MRITLDLEIKDVPGELIKVLHPISDHGGNIISIVHNRDKSTPRGRVPVKITFEIDRKLFEGVMRDLKDREIDIIRVGEQRLLEKKTVLLIGHIVHTDLTDTIDRIDSTGFAEVVDLQLTMPDLNYPSAALVTVSATGKKELGKALEILKDVGKKKKILVIEPVET